MPSQVKLAPTGCQNNHKPLGNDIHAGQSQSIE